MNNSSNDDMKNDGLNDDRFEDQNLPGNGGADYEEDPKYTMAVLRATMHLRDEINEKENEISRLKKELSDLQESTASKETLHQRELTRRNDEISRLKDEISRRENEIVRLKEELSRRNIPGGGNILSSAGSLGTTLRLGAIIAGVIVIVLLLGYTSVKSFLAKTSTTNIDIVAAFESCGEMTTYRAFFETVADKKEDGWFGRWRKFIVIFNGTLECGFDFQKANLEKISDPVDGKKGKINIYLPHCEVLGVNVLFENDERTGKKGMRIYDQQGGWFSAALTLEDQNEVVKEALKTVREKAVTEWKILRTAENNAVKLMKEFFAPLGYEVNITITSDVRLLRQPEKEQSAKAGGVSEIHTGNSGEK